MADKLDKKLSVIVAVSISVLLLGFLLLTKLGGVSVGKAVLSPNPILNKACLEGGYEGGVLTESKNFLCINKGWLVCDQSSEGDLESEKILCQNEEWVKCTKDLKYKLSDDENSWCNGNQWVSDFEVAHDEFHEVVLEKNKPAKDIKGKIGEINLCDKGTENVASTATLCYKEDKKKDQKIFAESVSKLASGNKKPYEQDDKIFLYEKEESPKRVNIIYLKDISKAKQSQPVPFLLQVLAQNQINGRRLALKLDGQYYLLSHPDADLFIPSQLELTHIPTLQKFLPVNIPGNKIQFSVFGKKAIVFEQKEDKMLISSATPEEAAAAFVLPFKLEEDYEVSFSLDRPVELTDLESTITVCGNDNKGDPQVLLVCVDDVYKFTLKKDVLMQEKIGGKDVALLYQLINDKKQGFIFALKELKKDESGLAYNDFINNLVAAKRIAFSFQGSLYLLEHPLQNLIYLSSTQLASYKESGSTSFKALGSEKKVEFIIPEGKVTLSRDFAVPPPPFKVSALTTKEVLDVPVNLSKELFTSMSSQVPVHVSPDLGIVEKDAKDTIKNKDLFKVDTAEENLQNLFFKKPLKIKNTLLYYFDASFDGSNYIKMVKFYHLYDLSQKQSHNFDNQFLDVFTAGNELALKFEDSYYLLGYKGKSGFFSISDLTLTTLEGDQQTLDETASTTATFSVPEGKIKITVDDPNQKIYFESISAKILKTEQFTNDDYSIILTPENRVEIDGTAYFFCPTSFTEGKEKLAALCENTPPPKIILQDKVKIYSVKNNDYLFWYKGVLDGKKQIFIHSIKDVAGKPSFSWGDFIDNIKEEKSKAFKWDDKYFLLDADDPDKLSSYRLLSIPDGVEYSLQNPQISENQLENGTFVYKNNLLFIYQTLDQNQEAQLNFVLVAGSILTGEGIEISSETTFLTEVNGEVFAIKPSVLQNFPNMILIEVKNSDGEYEFIGFLPEGAVKTILLSDGSQIQVEVLSVKNNKLNISKMTS